MRIYFPSSDAINGKWDPPAVQKVHRAFDWSPLASRPSIFSAYAGAFSPRWDPECRVGASKYMSYRDRPCHK